MSTTPSPLIGAPDAPGAAPAADAPAAVAKAQAGEMLRESAANGNAEGVRAWLPFADANERDRRQKTALMLAAEMSFECVEILLPASDARLADDSGNTALILAASGGDWAQMARLLLPKSDPLAQNVRGNNALMVAIAMENPAFCEALLPAIDLSQKRADGLDALACAAKAPISSARSLRCLDLLAGRFGDARARIVRGLAGGEEEPLAALARVGRGAKPARNDGAAGRALARSAVIGGGRWPIRQPFRRRLGGQKESAAIVIRDPGKAIGRRLNFGIAARRRVVSRASK